MIVWLCSYGSRHEGTGVEIVVATEKIALAWLKREHRKAAERCERVVGKHGKRHRPYYEVDSPARDPEDGWSFGTSTDIWVVKPMEVHARLPSKRTLDWIDEDFST